MLGHFQVTFKLDICHESRRKTSKPISTIKWIYTNDSRFQYRRFKPLYIYLFTFLRGKVRFFHRRSHMVTQCL